MKSPTTELARLKRFEEYFQKRLQKQAPRLLGDIAVSSEEVDQLGLSIGYFLRLGLEELLQEYPLTVCLFLVWCAVYHYKEGNFWRPIFAKLGLKQNLRDSQWLGDLFLDTLQSYGLQLPSGENTKKYMTPILMHGYISDYYAPQLLEYLNAVYGSYLEYDLSEQALASLWTDLFNLDQEQVKLKNNVDRLRQKELEIETQIASLKLPSILGKESRQQIDVLKKDIIKHHATIKECLKEVVMIRAKLNRLKEAASLFEECAAALEGIEEWNDYQDINNLSKNIKDGFKLELEVVITVEKEAVRKFKTSENALKIAQSRQTALLTEVVKLGDGNLESGYLILDDYNELAQLLEETASQRRRWEKLLEHEQELGNSSLRQVLTTSLTSLGKANPTLFQEFIKSTLKLLDSFARDETVSSGHRLSGALRRWSAEAKTRAKLRQRLSTDLQAVVAHRVPKDAAAERRRLSWTALRTPELRYASETRQLLVRIPEQNIPAPSNYYVAPRFLLNYKNKTEPIQCQHQIQNKKLIINDTETSIKSTDFAGITLNWYNLHEYWDLALAPIMIFDEDGKLQNDFQFPNGFYYVLVQEGWKTWSQQVVAKYFCELPNYSVYEIHCVESRLEFFTIDGQTVTLNFSQYSDISLQDVKFLSGVKQDSLPVGQGSPVLVINQSFLEKVAGDAVFLLDYNGGRIHEEALASLTQYKEVEDTGVSYKIKLRDFIPRSFKSSWQAFKIKILSGKGENLFERAFCVVRGLSLRFKNGSLRVRVPARSRLRNISATQVDGVYWLSYDEGSEIFFEVYFDKIGWKKFIVSTPSGQWQLFSDTEESLSAPLILLKSETHCLRGMTINFKAVNPSVKRVVVTDSHDHLIMKFNVSQGGLQIPLDSFADLFTDIEELSKIELRCEGNLGSGKAESVAEIYPKIELEQADLFCSEQEDEYLLELAFSTDYPILNCLRFRVYSGGDNDQVLFDRSLRSNPDYFFLKKDGLKALTIKAQIYHMEEITSIFGHGQKERICWESSIILPNRKEIFKKLQREGLVLTGFTYEGVNYCLSGVHKITNITVTSKNFEGEELFHGYFACDNIYEEVFFYLEEGTVIAALWDRDDDGVQYDPENGNMFWEMSHNPNIMGPLENLEFEFLESDGG